MSTRCKNVFSRSEKNSILKRCLFLFKIHYSSIFPPVHTIKKRSSITGFTFMELMLTVMVIAILVSIAIPSYISTVERARGREALATLESMRAAELAYSSERRIFLQLPTGTTAAENARWNMVGLENPNENANASWSYSYSTVDLSGTAARLDGPNVGETLELDNDGTITNNFTP